VNHICVVISVIAVVNNVYYIKGMDELSQRQQDRISKSSTDRLRSQLVRDGVDEGEVTQMERAELKSIAAQIEVGKQVGEHARQKPLPDDADELFESSEGGHSKSQEHEVLKLKLELRKMEIEAEARKMDREAEARKIELETRRLELEAQQREREAEREARKIDAVIKMAEIRAGAHGRASESSLVATEGEEVVAPQAVDNSLAGRTKRFGDA